MIGETNCKDTQTLPCEEIIIVCSTDQSDHNPLIENSSITVQYETYEKTYVWKGDAISIYVPAHVEYTISFGDVSNYISPTPLVHVALSGNIREIDVIYKLNTEKLTVNVSGITSGYTITVVNATTGATIGSQTTASKTYDIPAGTEYYVKGSGVSGYMSPNNSSTYTAVTGNARTVTMTYIAHTGTLTPSNGVYIQDTDGYFHTESAWDSSYTPNGIAVITSNCRFVMALADAHTTYCKWGREGVEVSGITSTTSETTANTDYNGEAQTTTILNELGNNPSVIGAAAAYYCRAYTFPNGKKGYLGAAGEWQTALDNKAAITSALSKCGGTAMNIHYWTSTQYSSDICWWMNWAEGYLSTASKSGMVSYPRAFAAI